MAKKFRTRNLAEGRLTPGVTLTQTEMSRIRRAYWRLRRDIAYEQVTHPANPYPDGYPVELLKRASYPCSLRGGGVL